MNYQSPPSSTELSTADKVLHLLSEFTPEDKRLILEQVQQKIIDNYQNRITETREILNDLVSQLNTFLGEINLKQEDKVGKSVY